MKPLIHAVTSKTILTAVFVFALAASVAAEPQRGRGGGHSGGGRGHSGAGGGQSGAVHPGGGGPRGHGHAGPRGHGHGGPRGHVHGGPRGHHHGHHGPRGHIIIRGGFYDPFWGPHYPYGYGYPYDYPYGPYEYSLAPRGKMKTEVTPKHTEVYVDGHYAGVADDFDGSSRLHTSPGGHAVSLHFEGYRTVTQHIYVQPNSTYKLKETMEKLAPGEVSEPVPVPALPPGRSDSKTPTPDSGSATRR